MAPRIVAFTRIAPLLCLAESASGVSIARGPITEAGLAQFSLSQFYKHAVGSLWMKEGDLGAACSLAGLLVFIVR